jgi:mono/diheme cytochrome c family protein
MIFASCKKNTEKVNFTNSKVKSIFDSRCASCHASGKSNSREWLYDPSDYNGSIKNNINDLYETVYQRKSMPKGSALSSDELSSFKSWYDAGYPAN